MHSETRNNFNELESIATSHLPLPSQQLSTPQLLDVSAARTTSVIRVSRFAEKPPYYCVCGALKSRKVELFLYFFVLARRSRVAWPGPQHLHQLSSLQLIVEPLAAYFLRKRIRQRPFSDLKYNWRYCNVFVSLMRIYNFFLGLCVLVMLFCFCSFVLELETQFRSMIKR